MKALKFLACEGEMTATPDSGSGEYVLRLHERPLPAVAPCQDCRGEGGFETAPCRGVCPDCYSYGVDVKAKPPGVGLAYMSREALAELPRCPTCAGSGDGGWSEPGWELCRTCHGYGTGCDARPARTSLWGVARRVGRRWAVAVWQGRLSNGDERWTGSVCRGLDGWLAADRAHRILDDSRLRTFRTLREAVD